MEALAKKRNRIDPNRPEKKCSSCWEVKPRSGYSCDRSRPDGLSSVCSECNKVCMKRIREKEKDHKRKVDNMEIYNVARLW